MADPVVALVRAYPERFTPVSAHAWVAARRALLTARTVPADTTTSVSSGCAATGARTHALGMADHAAHALRRLDAGVGTACERCGLVLPYERLDAVPTAVRCARCAGPTTSDTRWCR